MAGVAVIQPANTVKQRVSYTNPFPVAGVAVIQPANTVKQHVSYTNPFPMAGVAVIQPANTVKQRVSYGQNYAKPNRSRRNSTSNPRPIPNSNKNNRRKRSPQKNGSSDKGKNLRLVMGEVKILKRGEVLNVVKENKVEDMVLSTTDPDLDPVTEEQMTIADFYAGSAFVSSPPPSSLPVPAFFKKKIEDNHDATSDLRRLLRLHLS